MGEGETSLLSDIEKEAVQFGLLLWVFSYSKGCIWMSSGLLAGSAKGGFGWPAAAVM